MSASPVIAMAAAASLDRQDGKALCLKQRKIFPYGFPLRTMYRDSHLVQPCERARADTADDDGIDFLVIKRLHRVACAMGMVLIAVVDRCDAACIRVENNKYRRRAKVVIHSTLDPIVILDWKTDLHMLFLLCLIYTTIIQIR
jgi:hypothetical protein